MEGMNWNLPVLALRGLTVFPHMSMSLDVEREVSLLGIDCAGIRRGREHTPADQRCAEQHRSTQKTP